MKMVKVEWEDSCAHHGWREKDSKDYVPANCVSVGFLIRENKEAISVALSLSVGNEEVSEVMSIPRSCVKSIKELRCK